MNYTLINAKLRMQILKIELRKIKIQITEITECKLRELK